MYLENLKQLYCRERNKLEEMSVYKQESRLRILSLRKRVAQELESALVIAQIKGRSDITDEIKERMLFDGVKCDKIEQRLQETLNSEFGAIESETNGLLRAADYDPREYADYLLQLEKVSALERVLEEEKIFPQEAFLEEKQSADNKAEGRE